MKFKTGTELLNLPYFIKFGLEIEAQNVDFNELAKALKNNTELQGWKLVKDGSLTDNGAELVSPPLSELNNKDVYKKIQIALELLKKYPFDKKRNVYVNEQCGGHIHLDATKMRKNPEMIEAFLRIWAECEPIIYKICTTENDPIRPSAINNSLIDGLKRFLFSGFSEFYKISQNNDIPNLIKPYKFLNQTIKKTIQGYFIIGSSIFFDRNGFAHPIGKNIKNSEKKGNLIKKIYLTSNGNRFKFNKSLKALANHQTGINMQHFSENISFFRKLDSKNYSTNTYEYRIHNGTLFLDEIKKNLFLDVALSIIAYEMAYEPGKNDKKLSNLFEKDLTEEEKVDRFLELLFDFQEDRAIYKSRWIANKSANVFKNNNSFSNTFKKDALKNISEKQNPSYVLDTIKRIISYVKDNLSNENSGIYIEKFVMDYGGRNDE